ncbi:S24 family peptidase [Sphingomonas baiyangensis]|uniref:Helix-turn-helix transcriptional regulator n=1 Tax=Sphingomonas baiyangensis TaxID=2572576 RepID=A0A4U1L499_9SPHN|nr:S24 family peptidase [Sphingomonas baiyangensis]TKD51747.1 helix-turn-helix transcriptional regulator [Sphingomonas baiyangensis]
MLPPDPRTALAAAAAAQGVSLMRLSRVIGRNDAYVQQYVARGSPRVLPERERRLIADYLGIEDEVLGGPPGLRAVARFDVAASAGPGGVAEIDVPEHPRLVDPAMLAMLGVAGDAASMIRVAGASMAPTLLDGDDILVDSARRDVSAGGGVFVLRLDGVVMVKRVAPAPGGLHVSSDNPDAPDPGIVARARVRVIGRVVWVGRAL